MNPSTLFVDEDFSPFSFLAFDVIEGYFHVESTTVILYRVYIDVLLCVAFSCLARDDCAQRYRKRTIV